MTDSARKCQLGRPPPRAEERCVGFLRFGTGRQKLASLPLRKSLTGKGPRRKAHLHFLTHRYEYFPLPEDDRNSTMAGLFEEAISRGLLKAIADSDLILEERREELLKNLVAWGHPTAMLGESVVPAGSSNGAESLPPAPAVNEGGRTQTLVDPKGGAPSAQTSPHGFVADEERPTSTPLDQSLELPSNDTSETASSASPTATESPPGESLFAGVTIQAPSPDDNKVSNLASPTPKLDTLLPQFAPGEDESLAVLAPSLVEGLLRDIPLRGTFVVDSPIAHRLGAASSSSQETELDGEPSASEDSGTIGTAFLQLPNLDTGSKATDLPSQQSPHPREASGSSQLSGEQPASGKSSQPATRNGEEGDAREGIPASRASSWSVSYVQRPESNMSARGSLSPEQSTVHIENAQLVHPRPCNPIRLSGFLSAHNENEDLVDLPPVQAGAGVAQAPPAVIDSGAPSLDQVRASVAQYLTMALEMHEIAMLVLAHDFNVHTSISELEEFEYLRQRLTRLRDYALSVQTGLPQPFQPLPR